MREFMENGNPALDAMQGQVAERNRTQSNATERSPNAVRTKKTPDTDNYIGASPLAADESVSQKMAACPTEAIVQLCQELMPDNPQVKVLEDATRGGLPALLPVS